MTGQPIVNLIKTHQKKTKNVFIFINFYTKMYNRKVIQLAKKKIIENLVN